MDRTPFPDVTGLRLRAPLRDAFMQDALGALGRASITLSPSLSLDALAQKYGTDRSIPLQAAWAVIVYMYLRHECDYADIDVLSPSSSHTVRFGASLCDAHSLAHLLRHVQACVHTPTRGVWGPVCFFDALSMPAHDVNAWLTAHVNEHPTITLALVAHTSDTGDTLTLLASPSIHVHGSAMTQLQQVLAVLDAIVHDRDPMTLPVSLQSLANPHPTVLTNDMPHGPAHERLEDQFRRRAQDLPDTEALVCCESLQPLRFTSWTYRELDQRSDAIARLLWSLGIGYAHHDDTNDEIVALCLAKSHEMYAAILGILKAGATWCPIDPGWPSSRQAALLTKSEARVVLTCGAEAAAVEAICPASIHIARLDAPMPTCAPPRRSPQRASPQHLAYKIWTSGTTGLPKAVGIEHTAAVQGMRALQHAVPTVIEPLLPGSLRYLQFAAYVFDLSIFDIFYAWGHGGTVCFAPLDLLLTRLIDVSNALQVTHTLFTPAVSAMVPRDAIPSMRLVINGGEKLSQVVADNWTRDCRLVNIYGPAEATLSLTMRELPPNDQVKSHNIGVAFDDALCVIMDEHYNIVPRGAIGELLLGGPQLARGYIGDPAKTAEKFVMHPTLGRLYHTGDLARQLWDGQFEYLGRNDDQVKINGVRIELLEINAAVKSVSDQVWDADTVAMPAPQPDEPPRIVAFAVAPLDNVPLVREDEDAVALARTLRTGTQALLPSYMVPFHFVILSSFPRTSSAKIDRRAVKAAYDALDLRAWEAKLAQDPQDSTSANTADILSHPLAKAVQAHLVSLCHVAPEEIAPRVSLPMLGLNSVRAMAMSAALVEDGWPISAADLMQYDTLAKLVEQYTTTDKVDRSAHWHDVCASLASTYADQVRTTIQDTVSIWPTTSLQQGMLLETDMDATQYWLYRHLRTHAPITLDQLQAALQHVACEFDCLRLGFVPVTSTSTSPYAPTYVTVVHAEPRVQIVPLHGDLVPALRAHTPPAANGRPPWWVAWLEDGSFVWALHHALYDAPTLYMLLQRLDTVLTLSCTIHVRGSWQEALQDFIPTTKEEAASMQAWSELLQAFPQERVPFPRLLEAKATEHGLTSTARRASMPWDAWEALAQSLGTAVRPLVHVVWARILCAYLHTDAVLLGDVSALRGLAIDVGGPSLATIPTPVVFQSTMSMADMVQSLHQTQVQMQSHASIPLSYIRTCLSCAYNEPLFDSVVVLEMADDPAEERVVAWQHATDVGLCVEHATALEVRIELDGSVTWILNANKATISPSYAALLLDQVDALWQAVAKDVKQPCLALPMPSNLTSMAPWQPPTVPTYWNVAHWVEAYQASSSVAVEMRYGVPATTIQTLTYADLYTKSSALAGALVELYKEGSVVGVSLSRSVDTYICLAAVLRAGLLYLPLDESLPPARKLQLVQASKAACVLTDTPTSWPDEVVTHAPTLFYLHAPDSRPVSLTTPAYLLYTSGSTGEPKGCVITHANLAYAIDNFREVFEKAAPGSWHGARMLARSAEAFDVHILECFLALQTGATIVTMPRVDLMQDLGLAMADAKITHACVVPSLFYTQGRRVTPQDLPTIRALIVGGEKMADDIIQLWSDKVPLLNAYGPTEATIGISCTRVHPTTLASDLGYAFAGNQFAVRSQGRLTLRGEEGELIILGTHVGAGYWQKESEAFFDMDGQPAYATGDRVRMRPDGSIEYLGRMGHTQVKVRGARVELGDVDAALRDAGAAHAATLLLSHAQWPEPHLVAFLADSARVDTVPPERVEMDLDGMKTTLRAKLSSYMVPSMLVPLTYLPLARVSGKLDRRALEQIYASITLDDAGDDEPSTEAERAAAMALATVLPNVHVGVHTDLFGVGLDSLKAVRLARALQDKGLSVPLAAIMTYPTIAGLVQAATTSKERQGTATSTSSTWPCLPLQVATLSLTLAEPSQRWYMNHVRMTLDCDTTMPHDEETRWKTLLSWREAMAHFSIYRTVFTLDKDGSLVQQILPTLPAIEKRVLAPWSEEEAAKVSDDILQCHETMPLVRLTLFDDVLCISMHHAVYDATSFSLLCAAVDGDLQPDTWADVVYTASSTLEESTAHYTSILEGMVRTPMPVVTGQHAAKKPSCEVSYTMTLPVHALQMLAQDQRITMQALMLHAFAFLFSQYVGEDDVTLGVVQSGRMTKTAHETAHGPCITTLPFRWHNHSYAQVHDQLTSMLSYPFVRLSEVAHRLHLESSVLDVLFSYLPAGDVRCPRGIASMESTMASDFPLALQVSCEKEHVACTLTYGPDRMSEAHALLFLQQYEDVLRQALGEAQAPHLGACVHPTPLEPAESESFLHLFLSHVHSHPEADALTFATCLDPLKAETLSYAELDRRSSLYASHLQMYDGQAVYVHLPRGIELYVVLLATWKLHKTYVPLDPTLPAERLQYMMETVGDGLLVSDTGLAAPCACVDMDALRATTTMSPWPTPRLDVPAYILFTSGSTGRPKGVQISHRALAAAIQSWKRMLPYQPTSRILQLASPGFDVSLFEVCLPWSLGFAVATAPKEMLLTDLELAFRQLRITIADLPAALAALVHPANVGPMEWLMSGGDMLDERVVKTWGSPPHTLINAYGPTEGTIGNTLGKMDATTRRSVVGSVYPATTLYIYQGDRLAYTGTVGEIVVGGPQVGDGYVHAPELTASAFPKLPNGQRVYRTGDRGRLLLDGRVECLGRIARGQVKVNGQRVELDEIAHALTQSPSWKDMRVVDASVLYLQHPSHASKQLVAFLALSTAPMGRQGDVSCRDDEDATLLTHHCLAYARHHLAPYMVPTYVFVLQGAMPLTPNNKVDTKRLTEAYMTMDLHALRTRSLRPAKMSPMMQRLIKILADFCGMPATELDPTASMYALGIDSLSALRLIRVLREHGIQTTASTLLTHATPERLALALERGSPDEQADEEAYQALCRQHASLLPPGTWPCTPLQAGMLAHTVASHNALYVHLHAMHIDAAPDVVERAWLALVAQHSMLRTTFISTSDDSMPWVQHVADTWPSSLTRIHPPTTPSAVLCATARAACQYDTQPHALHMTATSTGTYAVLSMHHALYDAHTIGELWDDWDQALQGRTVRARPPWSQALPRLCTGASHVPYWLDTLHGYIPRPLAPMGCPPLACTADFHTNMPLASLQQVARAHSISMHTMVTLAFAYLLAECMGSADVCFGQVLSLRSEGPDTADVLGPMLNTVPTRICLTRTSIAQQWIALQRAIDASRPHRHAPLRTIATQHQSTHTSPAPLIDALLDVQRHEDTTPWQHIHPVPLDEEDGVQYALNVEVIQKDTLCLVATARRAWADEAQLQAHLQRFATILQEMVDAPASMRALPESFYENISAPMSITHHPVPTSMVDQLRQLIADVAQVPLDTVESDTPLLALGLDSIAAIHVLAQARARHMSLQVSDLAGGTPAAAAAAWYARSQGTLSTAIPQNETSLAMAPLTDAWQVSSATWEAVRPVAAGQAMHVAMLVQSHFHSGLFSLVYQTKHREADRLAEAWTQLQQRHEILRTWFGFHETLVQVVESHTTPLRVTQASSMADIEAIVAQRGTVQDAHTPWTSADLVQLEDHTSVLILTLFHAVYDGWMLPLLLQDLDALYRGETPRSVPGITPLLALPAPSPADLQSVWGVMANVPSCLLGATATTCATYTFVQRKRVLTKVTSARRYVAQHHATWPSLLLAAWAHVLQSTLHQSNVLFGVYRAARTLPIDHVGERVMPTLNMLPICVEEAPWHTMAQAVAHHLQQSAPYEHVSLPALHAALDWDTAPRFNTCVNVLWNDASATQDAAQATWSPVPLLSDSRLRAPKRILEHSNLSAWPEAACYATSMIAVDAYIDQDESLSLSLRCPASVATEEDAMAWLSNMEAYIQAAVQHATV